MIADESEGPAEADIVRAWHFPDVAASVLWVATRRSLWQYDLDYHRWFEIALDCPERGRGDAVAIDVDSGSGEIAVTVTAGSETFQGTAAKVPGRRLKIALARSRGAALPRAGREESAAVRISG